MVCSIYLEVEGLLAGHGHIQQIARGGVLQTLRLASRSRCVQDEERVFAIDWLAGADRAGERQLLVHPHISARDERDGGVGVLVDEAVLDIGAAVENLGTEIANTKGKNFWL